ncbi:helicase c2 [Ectothiorhodospira sp. PHS-1]|uniref:ATP-dependent DNA helicase n=1 Tax=Ectothiorhodospira sp. PHS-1 TaxID=519989 RepID=UPI00024A8617|nr:ATP-dependent DNA helicase [Ectothiorhodospira sp. PHS-1]EHQ51746.1 helicase c2 [Ectothiorhodospira sp. PHS-1]
MTGPGEAAEWLGDDGPLANAIEGFRARLPQQQMAAAVAQALEDQDTLVVEAGTGVGKTFAYLVPALLSGRKVIVSTGTRNLQDQLFHKDLPLICRTLGLSVRCALLKGRSNYLCPHRLGLTVAEGALLEARLHAPLRLVERWAAGTRTGDTAELSQLAEDAEIWPRVTSTADNCLGTDCPEYAGCYVLRARRRAQEADLVVINHHLLFADLALKDEGFGELLPAAEAFILDEAHQLPEVAGNFFGVSLSARQLLELARDTVSEQVNEAPDMPQLRERADSLSKAVKDFRLAMGEGMRRAPWPALAATPGMDEALQRLRAALQSLAEALEVAAERGKGLEGCARRVLDLLQRLALFDGPQEDAVQWYETWTRTFSLHLTPLDVAGLFRQHRGACDSAWVFTSATLSVDGRFDHFNRRLGLGVPRGLQLDSPFDYAANARLYIPSGLPEPNDPGYTTAVAQAALPVIEANPGGTFMLFTSHKALQAAAAWLSRHLDRLVLVQGTAPRQELVARFREAGNAVLLGAQSFWEGVDVRGRALSCVIIDRLPFASPGDPVLEARMEAIRREGGSPFTSLQIPQAVIALKQGVGRLIRDPDDKGLLVLCDPRLQTKSYGRIFMKSLPPVGRVRDLDQARTFLQGLGEPSCPQA